MAMDTLLEPSVRRVHRMDRLPTWRSVGYTFNISVRFLASWAAGNGTVERADQLLRWYWRKILLSGDCALYAAGRHHFTPGAAHVVMSNHSSLLDIPAILGAVPGSVRMVTKEELFRVPVWGRALHGSGFIPLDRKNRRKAILQLERAQTTLRSGVNVWISPEGTRSRDGRLGPFKKGGFHTAMALGVPIIPAWIEGASGIIPPDQWKVRYGGRITVSFGPPVQTAHHAREDLAPLMGQVRAAILKLAGTRAAEVDAPGHALLR